MQNGVKLQAINKDDEAAIDPFQKPIDAMLQEGQHEMAYRLLKILRRCQTSQKWVEERLSSLYRKWIPRWHFEMLNDGNRGKAFVDALAALDLRDKTVLDIGAGSGILSMLAVRSGARHVFACEAVEPLADMAVEIVRQNGLAHKITIIPKSSFNVEIGQDMPARAEVMLSETIDCGFVGEGFLSSLAHAKKHLLKPDALLVPSTVQLFGALVESPHIYQLNHVDRSQGFDISKMNEFCTPGYFGVRLRTRPHRMLSEVKTLVDIDLYGPLPERITRLVEFEAMQTGTVHGVVFWFQVVLASGIALHNDPGQSDCHWTQAFATFHDPMPVREGERYAIELTFSHHAVHMIPSQQPRHEPITALNVSGPHERSLSIA